MKYKVCFFLFCFVKPVPPDQKATSCSENINKPLILDWWDEFHFPDKAAAELGEPTNHVHISRKPLEIKMKYQLLSFRNAN